MTLDYTTIKNYVVNAVFIASVTNMLMPPWEMFSDYPRFQKFYKLVASLVGYVAVNLKSKIYPAIATDGGTRRSQIAVDAVASGDAVRKSDPIPSAAAGK